MERSSQNGPSPDPRLLVILGPTATGKSSLAVELAQVLNGEIVNCDAMQTIKGFDLGTAKPTTEQRSTVPHHLYDIVEPGSWYSAGQYMKDSRRVCQEIAERQRLPIVVGGTGLYIRALLQGVFSGPARSEPMRQRLNRIVHCRGTASLHRILARNDPVAASRIPPADRVRIVRALEVFFLTGRPISSVQKVRRPLPGFQVLKVGLSLAREQLYDRIDRRVEAMFACGLVEETRGLLRRFSAEARGFQALGYRQAVSVVRGDLSVQEAITLTQRDTRRYAKRQLTWFRKERDVKWLDLSGEHPSATRQALALIDKRQLCTGTIDGDGF